MGMFQERTRMIGEKMHGGGEKIIIENVLLECCAV